MDSIFKVNFALGRTLVTIDMYNKVNKILGYSDTIKVVRNNNEYDFYYKETLILDFRFSIDEKPIMLEYSEHHEKELLFSSAMISPQERREIYFNWNRTDITKSIIKLSHYKKGVLNGKYSETRPDGSKIMEGNYCQIDSNYIEKIELIDPESYDSIIKEVKRDKFPVKEGKWNFYDTNGQVINQEEY